MFAKQDEQFDELAADPAKFMNTRTYIQNSLSPLQSATLNLRNLRLALCLYLAFTGISSSCFGQDQIGDMFTSWPKPIEPNETGPLGVATLYFYGGGFVCNVFVEPDPLSYTTGVLTGSASQFTFDFPFSFSGNSQGGYTFTTFESGVFDLPTDIVPDLYAGKTTLTLTGIGAPTLEGQVVQSPEPLPSSLLILGATAICYLKWSNHRRQRTPLVPGVCISRSGA